MSGEAFSISPPSSSCCSLSLSPVDREVGDGADEGRETRGHSQRSAVSSITLQKNLIEGGVAHSVVPVNPISSVPTPPPLPSGDGTAVYPVENLPVFSLSSIPTAAPRDIDATNPQMPSGETIPETPSPPPPPHLSQTSMGLTVAGWWSSGIPTSAAASTNTPSWPPFAHNTSFQGVWNGATVAAAALPPPPFHYDHLTAPPAAVSAEGIHPRRYSHRRRSHRMVAPPPHSRLPMNPPVLDVNAHMSEATAPVISDDAHAYRYSAPYWTPSAAPKVLYGVGPPGATHHMPFAQSLFGVNCGYSMEDRYSVPAGDVNTLLGEVVAPSPPPPSAAVFDGSIQQVQWQQSCLQVTCKLIAEVSPPRVEEARAQPDSCGTSAMSGTGFESDCASQAEAELGALVWRWITSLGMAEDVAEILSPGAGRVLVVWKGLEGVLGRALQPQSITAERLRKRIQEADRCTTVKDGVRREVVFEQVLLSLE